MRELYRMREQRFVGIQLGIVYYPPTVLTERGFKLVFYNPSDVKIGELGSDIKTGHVSEVEFELMDFGCGAFSFVCDERPAFDPDYRTRMDIHPYFDLVPWFTGFIQDKPRPGGLGPFQYSGFGFFEQLDWVHINGSYQSQDIADIVKDIVQNTVAPNTQIIYNAAKVETTGYTINSISFDYTKAKDAIQTLAEVAQNFEFGVDNVREFYFRAIDTAVKHQFWAGKHFRELVPKEDPKTVRNKLYVKVGQIQAGGSNIVGNVSDSGSITDHGLHEDIITAPEILSSTDALSQWAPFILSQKKDPTVGVQVADLFLDEGKTKIEALGKIRVTAEDGEEYTLPVKRVLYKISAAGIVANIELGTVVVPLEDHILKMFRRIEEETRLADKRTKQLYT